MSNKPNILFILSDQHNAKVLGHAGHPDVKTPNLDRMAAKGIRFENAITQNPVCTPSRVSFLSGQYCHNHGYYGLRGPNPTGLPSILGHFRQAGYRSAAIGKIHCPEYWVENDCDVFHESAGCSIGGRSAEYTAFLRERGKEDLEDHSTLTEFGMHSMEGRPSNLTYEESQEGWIAAKTIEFMKESAAAGKPFFAHASLPRPHSCTAPSEPFWSMYEGKELTLPPNADSDLEGEHRAPHLLKTAADWRKAEWALFEPKTFEAARLRKLHGYLGAVSQVDHAVGQMMDYLSKNGLAENTIVIYSADHGEYVCEHGIMEKAPGICHDAVTRIPFIWWAPGRFKAGHVVKDLVESVDVSTTLCALAGLEPLVTADGQNISHLLLGESGEVREVAVTEFAWSKSVRGNDFRLVWYPKEMFPEEYPEGFGELYDLRNDPWETRNLFFEPEYQDQATALEKKLLEWLVTTTRPVTVHEVNGVGEPVFEASSQTSDRYKCRIHRDGKFDPNEIRKLAGRNYV